MRLTRRPPSVPGDVWLTAERAREDLDQLEWLVERRYAYRWRRPVDLRPALDTLRLALGTGLRRAQLAVALQQVLALLADAHVRVRGLPRMLRIERLPLAVEPAGPQLIALTPDLSRRLDPAHPLLVAIDGLPLADWLTAAAGLGPGGTAAHARRQALRWLPAVGLLRCLLARPAASTATLTLASLDGARQRTIELPLAGGGRPPPWPPGAASRRLAGGVGLLRIPELGGEPADLARVQQALRDLQGCPALVLDLRGNGGGYPELRHLLGDRLLRETRAVALAAPLALSGPPRPYGVNLTQRRLRRRFWQPADAGRSPTAAARAARALAGWAPRPPVPAGFGPWAVALAGPVRPSGPARPLAILQDAGCFSATELLLLAFKGRPHVTRVGTTSGGGSGWPGRYRLFHSQLEILLPRVVVYGVDGALLDRRGVTPDVVVARRPSDLGGGTDHALETAHALLLKRLGK